MFRINGKKTHTRTYNTHNRAIRPCHPSHSMPVSLNNPVCMSMYVCMYVCKVFLLFVCIVGTSAGYGSTGYGCQSCSWSAEQRKYIFPHLRSRLRIWFRETASAVPSRVSLLILHTQTESGAFIHVFIKFQSAKVGRIRSYCQGWTELDDCEQRGHVEPVS